MTRDDAQRGLPRWLIVVLGAAGTAVVVLGLRVAAPLISPVVLAFVLTVAVHPLIDRIQRRGSPRWVAVGCAVLVVDGTLIALGVAVVLSLGHLLTVLPTYADQWQGDLSSLRDGLGSAGVGAPQAQDILGSLEPAHVLSLLTGLLGHVTDVVGGMVFVLATVLFMCADASTLPARLTAAGGPGSPMGPALASFARRTRSYIVVTAVFGAVVAVLDTLGLLVIGVPLALLWGVLSFITNFIPYIGFVLGVLPPMLLGLLSGGWSTAITVLVLYSAINFVLQSLIQPAFVGDAVGLSVTVSFLSLFVWAWVLGPLGAILAVPMTLLIQTAVLETDPSAAWARALLAHPTTGKIRGRRPGRRGRSSDDPAVPEAAAEGAAEGAPEGMA